jgi:hypothetical protein
VSLPLTGTVTPNASSKTIVWSIHDAGTTGATIHNGILHTRAAGTVAVMATIQNGTAVGVSYWQVFRIRVHPWGAPNTPPPGGPAPGFLTASDWAVGHLNQAYTKGFIPLGLQGSYKTNITRGEFAHLAMSWVNYYTGRSNDQLLREFGLTYIFFDDVPDNQVIGAAAALGITAGVGGNLFGVNQQFDRQQAATMVANVMRVVNPNYTLMMADVRPQFFLDESQASSWARTAINFAGQYGFMNGIGGGRFHPLGTFTREESIALFNNMG